MNRKTVWTILSLVLLAAMVLSACGAAATTAPATEAAKTEAPVVTEAPTEAPKEMVTIRWRTRPDNQAEQDVYQKISDDLSAQLASEGIT
ncbi:MAG: hypothetical protein HGA86_01375, partial [Anaerolineaceae bacterium]|nr:hypothetical protein [Anaerolineaceae bacterium]